MGAARAFHCRTPRGIQVATLIGVRWNTLTQVLVVFSPNQEFEFILKNRRFDQPLIYDEAQGNRKLRQTIAKHLAETRKIHSNPDLSLELHFHWIKNI
ncbi:hypothetical protein MGI18_01960 [Bacillus sp. OVS6]|nr:hypothetical protein MGI18_01960 [Bacillus sp. OVS6]